MGLRRRQLADADEALAGERREVDRGHERAEGHVGADVGGRLAAADVLLARLQGEHEAALPVAVHRGADETARHPADELLLGREDTEVRPPEAQRHAKPLPFADDDIRAEPSRRFENAQVHGVGDDDQQRPRRVRELRGGREVFQAPVEVRALDDERRRLRSDELLQRGEVGHAVRRRGVAQPDSRPLAVRGRHAAIERVHAAREDDLGPLGDGVGHQRRLGQGRRAVIDRRVRHVHAGELGDHRLVLVDRPQGPLARLGLVGRVRREELAARDQVVDRAGDVVIVGARAHEADVRVGVGVPFGERLHVTDQIGLGEGGRQVERPREPRLRGDLDEQLLDPTRTDHAEHLSLLGRRVGDVPRGHQWPPCLRNSSYCSAVRSWSHSALVEGLTTIIQPLP